MILENPAASFSFATLQDGDTKKALEEIRALIASHESQQIAYSAAAALGRLTTYLVQMGISSEMSLGDLTDTSLFGNIKNGTIKRSLRVIQNEILKHPIKHPDHPHKQAAHHAIRELQALGGWLWQMGV